ncbi:unnamed protein product [Soboliphyme baturini]|uniref:WD_REPEATS_REGION domain-containing protein n=1 Tax=Soboliphyme baturini TaxID=241478 RepID=A0A183IXT2_9BILA|nr:unnamed protein product [Soboliphyme baturini]
MTSFLQLILDVKLDRNRNLSIYSTIYTSPRRPMFGCLPEAGSTSGVSDTDTFAVEPLIQTEFVKWCTKRFAEPILHYLSDQEAQKQMLSITFSEVSDWALEALTALSTPRVAFQPSFSRSTASPSSCLAFLPLHPLLCTGDGSGVNVWDWESGRFICGFQNQNKTPNELFDSLCAVTPGRVTAIHIVNPYTDGYMLVGTDTGEVRIWDCHFSSVSPSLSSSQSYCKPELVTGWNAMGDVQRFSSVPSTHYYWEQNTGLLFVGGDFRELLIWDAHREQNVAQVTVGSASNVFVTSISADSAGHHLTAVGCSDGTVRLFDRRLPTNDCNVMTLRCLQSPVCRVHLQTKSIGSKLLAGTVAGDLCLWDPRIFQEPVAYRRLDDGGVRSIDAHRSFELIAVASSTQTSILTFDWKLHSVIRPSDGFIGQRSAASCCVHFHPLRAHLAVSATDGTIVVYGLAS